jgi:hypothetical protein
MLFDTVIATCKRKSNGEVQRLNQRERKSNIEANI